MQGPAQKTYPSILILMKARVASLDWAVNTISTNRMILAATANPPAPRIAITLIFFFFDICRVIVNGRGRRRMMRSLTQLTTASARMMDVSSRHVPSTLTTK